MIALVPSWAHHYDEFWDAIKRRNLWFIKLRYGAVLMLLAFTLTSEFILGFTFSIPQLLALYSITFAILFYNIILHWIRKFLKCNPGQFNPLHFSLLQMVLDLTALGLLVHFTGGIESPLFLLFIFHMIIGSLILPGTVIYTLAVFVILLFNGLIFAEYYHHIPHHAITGLLTYPLFDNFKFIFSFGIIFAFVVIMSVVLANRIANQLYRMEQKLVESFNKLQTAETEKQKYIMGVVHEIKSPLSVVQSYLDIVLQKYLGPLDSKVESRLKRARARSVEAIQLINDVLKISRLRLLDEITVEEIDIFNLISSIIKKHSSIIEQKEIDIKLKEDEAKKYIINGDKLLLEMAFSNLVGNALKYIGDEGKVEVKITEIADEIYVSISDNGIGISQQDMQKIFKDFFRAANIKQKGYEGSGMGLSIVKQIVERHGGKISVESPSNIGNNRNPGSTFNLKFPVNRQ